MAKEGIPYIILFVVPAAIFAALGWWIAAGLCFGLAAFMAFFFRNPERACPVDDTLIISPADGRVVVGGWRDTAASREIGEDETPTAEIQRHLDAFLREHGIDAAVTHRWAGTMGFSHDALPYVGQTGPRLFVCGGFTGHGMAFGPASAELVATLIRGGAHQDADLFDPSR